MPKRKVAPVASTPVSRKKQRSDADLITPSSANSTSASATRSSGRLKSTSEVVKITKSKYFEDPSSEDEGHSNDDGSNDSASGYDESGAESEASESSAEDEVSDSDEQDRKRKRGKPPKKQPQESLAQDKSYAKSDLWREGVKTGLGPGKAVFIERPKARGDMGIKYVPEKIHPATMEFLADLKKNNDRIWLKAHDADFRTSWKDFESFVEVLSEKIAEIDDTVPELPPKDLVFRIYRDVRFSSDPTPYKPHFSVAFSRTGRKGPYAAYYIQIQPGGKSFVGSGLWHPDAAPLALLRTDIDQHPENIKNVLLDTDVRKHLLGASSKDTKKVLQAFCKQNAENALKTKPKVSHA